MRQAATTEIRDLEPDETVVLPLGAWTDARVPRVLSAEHAIREIHRDRRDRLLRGELSRGDYDYIYRRGRNAEDS